jgi:hypothetical protein
MPQLTLIRNFKKIHQKEFIEAQIGDRVIDLVPKDFPIDRVAIVHSGTPIPAEDNKTFLSTHWFQHKHEDVILTVVPGIVTVGLFLLGTLISVGLSLAIRALLPPPKPDNRQLYDNSEESPTYGWDGIQNTTGNGTPKIILDGIHKVGGHILTTYTDVTDDNRHELFMLIGLGAGPIGAINGFTEDTSPSNGTANTWQAGTDYAEDDVVVPTDRNRYEYHCETAGTSYTYEPDWGTTVGEDTEDGTVTWTCAHGTEGLTGDDIGDTLTINGTPAKYFDGLRVYYRMGNWDQRPVPGFNNTQVPFPLVDYSLPYNTARTYETAHRVNAIRLIFQFKGGLYSFNAAGAFSQKSVSFRIRIRPRGETTWWFPHTASERY